MLRKSLMCMHNENNDNKEAVMMMGRGDANYKQRNVLKNYLREILNVK